MWIGRSWVDRSRVVVVVLAAKESIARCWVVEGESRNKGAGQLWVLRLWVCRLLVDILVVVAEGESRTKGVGGVEGESSSSTLWRAEGEICAELRCLGSTLEGAKEEEED